MQYLNLNKLSKRGISDVITTVLIILITITAIGILGGFVISFTRTSLNEATRCVDIKNEITIIREGSCYQTLPEKITDVRIRFGKINVSQIYIVLDDEGNSRTETKSGDELPNPNGGIKTYTFTEINSTTVKVGAYVQDKQCEVSDSTEIGRCRI